MGVNADLPNVEDAAVETGRFFSADEEHASDKVAVLGGQVVKDLFGDQNPIGQKIKIKKTSFDIIGTMKMRGSSGFQNQDNQISPQIVKNPIQVEIKTTNLTIPFRFTTDNFNLLTKVISFDTARNQIMVEDILNQVKNGKKILMLSERKEHLEILNLYLKGKCETILISGDDSAAKRVIKLNQIENGHYQAILSTGQFFGEGLDIRGITCLILAFPFSFEGKLAQYIGRMRDIGKQKLIIDYRDQQIPFLEKQFKQRSRFYKKMTFKIVTNTNQIQMF